MRSNYEILSEMGSEYEVQSKMRSGSAREISSVQGASDSDILMFKAITLYHYGKKQKDIAPQLKISTSKLNILIKKAFELGIIKTELNFNYFESSPFIMHEALISLLFNEEIPNPKVIVTPVIDPNNVQEKGRIFGGLAANYFDRIASNGCKIVLDGGMTVSNMIDALGDKPFENLHLYPVAGGPPSSPYTSVHAIIGRVFGKFGEYSGLRPHFLPPPSEIGEEKSKRSAQEILNESQEAEIFILGIGAIYSMVIDEIKKTVKKEMTNTFKEILSNLNIGPKNFDDKIIGISGYSAYDEEGNYISSPLDDEMYKLSGDHIKKAARDPNKHVIILANDVVKAQCVKAVLKGGWCNTLIIDELTANEVNKHVYRHHGSNGKGS